jgi:succinoglycan biosynthesis transport protein ExoP
MRQLTPQSLSKVFLRNLIFIAPFAVIGILVGNYFSSVTTPQYRAYADLFISTPVSAVDIGLLATGSTFSQERVKSYTQIISAPSTLQPVIDRLELNTTPQALAMRLSASAPSETVVIRLTVVDENPQRAAAIANEVGEQFALTAESLELPLMDLTSPVKVTVVRPAVPEYSPISPKKNTNRLLGATSFLFLAFLFFLIKYSLDLTVKNVTDLRGLKLLAAIGFDPNADRQPLINEIGSYEARNEAFRGFRTNFASVTGEKYPVAVAVLSGVAEEGKTSTSINMAISFANQGVKTLIIEGDLRRPRFKQYLNLQNSPSKTNTYGLTHLLQSDTYPQLKRNLAKSIYPVFEFVDVVFAGEVAANPTELLASPRLNELIKEVKSRYQIIIIDCPPVLPIADAAVVCKVVDGCVLIVHGGKTRIKAFVATIDAIKGVVPQIYGVIINKIPNNRESEDYGYLSGYNRYYKGTYGYILKKRGYTPYGPYSPKEILAFEEKSRSVEPNAGNRVSKLGKLWPFKEKTGTRVKHALRSTNSRVVSDSTLEDDEVTKWLNEYQDKSKSRVNGKKTGHRDKR